MTDIKKVISNNLIKLRKQNKLTQLELAEKINYSDKAISRWENGEVTPDIETLYKLSEIYKVDIKVILDENLNIEKLQKDNKATTISKLVISLLAISCVWITVTVLYVIFLLTFNVHVWQFFVFAFPVTFIVAIVFNSLWGKRPWNYVFISLLIWTILTSFYIGFFKYNIWPLFILGAPAQIVVVLWSRLKKKKK